MPPVDPVHLAIAAGGLLAIALVLTARWSHLALEWPRAVLAAVAVVSLAAAACLVRLDPPGLRLRIDPSTEPLLPRNDPGRDAYAEAVHHFGNDEVFVVAMECGAGVFTQQNLEAMRRVAERIERLEGVQGVQSLIDVYSFRYVPEEDWIEVRPFLEEIPSDPAALAALRARAVTDPLYRRTMVSDDGRSAALNVSFRPMSDADFIAGGLDGKITAILAEETAPGRRFHVAGRPHIKNTVFEVMLRDIRLFLPIAIAAMAISAWVAFNSLRGVAIPLGVALVGTLWTFGGMALADRPLTILTTLLGPSLLAMGCTFGVHCYGRYEEDVARIGDPLVAARQSLAHLVSPVLIAGTTTMIGFGALMWSAVPAVFELGALSVLGVAALTLLTLTAVPAALVLLPLPRRFRREQRSRLDRLEEVLDVRLAALADASARHAGAVIVVWAALALVAASLVPRTVVDTDYLSYFDEDSLLRRDFDAVNRALAGAVPLFVPLHAEPGAFREPALLRRVEALQARLDVVPGVSRTISIVDTLRVLNRAIEGDDPAAERIPATREEVAELLLLVPKGEAGRLANVDASRLNLVVRTGEVGSAAVRRLAADLESALRASRLPDGVRAAVTGNAILLNRAADGVAASQPWMVGLTAIAIFVLITVMLRSLRLGIVGMIPNALPVLLFFGMLGAGFAPLSLPTSLIGSVALGISIDDTAHYLFRYREERRRGASPAEAVHATTRRVGRAVVVASLILIAGFGVVSLSGFATLREFGLLSTATLICCVFGDLVLLPALLVRTRS